MVVGQRDEVDAGVRETLDERRIGAEHGPGGVELEGIGGRILEVGDREIRVTDQGTNGAGIAGSLEPRQIPPERGAAVARRDRDAAPVEREIHALAVGFDGLGDASIEQDVATRHEGPGEGRVISSRSSEWGLAGWIRERDEERPRPKARDTLTAEQRAAFPAERADARIHVIREQKAEPIPVGRHVGPQRGCVWRREQEREVRDRVRQPEGNRDLVTLIGHHLDSGISL